MDKLTKEVVIAKLKEIRNRGWIKNARPGNDGGAGNTLEDLLGVAENNLALPDAGDWELKTHHKGSTALTTLFRNEPEPREAQVVADILVPKYGWPHDQAGLKYPANEQSFRQTIHASERTDRGFGLHVLPEKGRLEVSFDHRSVDERHQAWLQWVRRRAGLGALQPTPFWDFDVLKGILQQKLGNCFFVETDVERRDGRQWYRYSEIYVLEAIDVSRFAKAMAKDDILLDFDARTGHNHGTKFRLRQHVFPQLYQRVQVI